MLKFEFIPGDDKAQEIIKTFINNRLIALIEQIILDEVDWQLAMEGDLENTPKEAGFADLVDIDKLASNLDFAANVSMTYLPDNYPVDKANREFFGLYKLLKARKEYVPELPMEYVLYHIIMNEVWQVDMINEDSEDGMFDDLKDDPFFAGIEDEEYTTVEKIPEPERSVALDGLKDYASELEEPATAEEVLSEYEDLRNYGEICFWDTDFTMLDDYDEEALIHSELGKYMGLGERQDVKKMEMEIGGSKVKVEMNIAPWESERLFTSDGTYLVDT